MGAWDLGKEMLENDENHDIYGNRNQTKEGQVMGLSWGYAWTYCCPTRGIVLGLSRVGMVGMKGVVGGSEGRRGE